MSSASFVPFGQGRARGMTERELGTHGLSMDRLVALGLTVVPGLTIPADAVESLTSAEAARDAVDLVEQLAGRRIADGEHPVVLRLLASPTEAGAPGVPPDLPGIGITTASTDRLRAIIGADDSIHAVFAAAVRYIGEHALGVDSDAFADADFDAADDTDRAARFLALCEKEGRAAYPDDPAEQLALAAQAVLARWQAPRARRSRRSQGFGDDVGLALHVQAIRVGNRTHSGHGTAESRNPASGAFQPTGTFRRGVRRGTPDDRPTESIDAMPNGTALLTQALRTLEHHVHGVARVEFEVRDDGLALLSAQRVERPSAQAVVRNAVDLASAGVMTDADAVGVVRPADLDALLHPQLRLSGREVEFIRGLPAALGAAVGRIALSSDTAVEMANAGDAVVLIGMETTPGDLPGMLAARAIVTARGGLASHAAVVARGLGRPAICGAHTLSVDLDKRRISNGSATLDEGDLVSVDGVTGTLYVGTAQVVPPEPGGALGELLVRADGIRRLGVRANADSGRDAAMALQGGAEGIGLCRTEHQFLGDRLPLVRRFLLATEPVEEAAALVALGAAQREDFLDLLTVMGNRPVTVRLLDAPLHEFLGDEAHESNPMLGLRGVRLALLREQLYPTQAKALFSAWAELVGEGVRPGLEVMIPLVAISGELAGVVPGIRAAAVEVEEQTGVHIEFKIGTMVETPRAALIADRLVEEAEFLSFGTNDLTQLTYGFSRDDVEAQVLTAYVEKGIVSASPFAELDADGVAVLMEIAVAKARSVRPDVKLGICGEHGGEPSSIAICERLGLDYVSCSPTRVPGARLAAAHAAMARTEPAAAEAGR